MPYEEFTDSPGIHTLTLLDWQREASLDLFVRIHSSLGYFPDTAIGTIPQANDTVYKPSQGLDGTEVGPIPYWSGLINGKGRRKIPLTLLLASFQLLLITHIDSG